MRNTFNLRRPPIATTILYIQIFLGIYKVWWYKETHIRTRTLNPTNITLPFGGSCVKTVKPQNLIDLNYCFITSIIYEAP